MSAFSFEQDAFEDFVDWGVYDKRRFARIHDLLKATLRDPFNGPGKPEPLKGNLKGCWSRRIDDKHRLVYRVASNGDIEVISCKGHYGDK